MFCLKCKHAIIIISTECSACNVARIVKHYRTTTFEKSDFFNYHFLHHLMICSEKIGYLKKKKIVNEICNENGWGFPSYHKNLYIENGFITQLISTLK